MKLHNPLQQVIYAAGKINMPFETKKHTEHECSGGSQLAHGSPRDVNSTLQLRGPVAGTAGNTERNKL